MRARWAAIGAAVAVSLGGGAILVANAAVGKVTAQTFVAIDPCRLNDTRGWDELASSGFQVDDALAAGDANIKQVRLDGTTLGFCDDELAGVTFAAVVMNVTVTGTTAASHLTIWPLAQSKPDVSSLNWVAGQTVANSVTVKVGTAGDSGHQGIQLFNNAGTTEFILDVVGYYPA